MPPLGLLIGGVDFSQLFIVVQEGAKSAAPYVSLAAAEEAGAVLIRYGIFINTVISFIIVAFAIFMVVKGINNMRREEEAPPAEPTTKDCQFCFSSIPIKASRCPNCTSELGASAR
jgi:large conductance mechanosensitive channel